MRRFLLISMLVGFSVSGLFAAWAVDEGFYVIPVPKMAIPKGAIIMWSGEIDDSGHPVINGQSDKKWHACDGNNGTPDLRDRFVRGSSVPGDIGGPGGSDTVTLGIDNLPPHDHGGVTDNGSEKHRHGVVYTKKTVWYTAGPWAMELVSDLFWGETPPYYEVNTNYYESVHNHKIGVSGAGASFEHIPAHYALTFIMYTGD